MEDAGITFGELKFCATKLKKIVSERGRSVDGGDIRPSSKQRYQGTCLRLYNSIPNYKYSTRTFLTNLL